MWQRCIWFVLLMAWLGGTAYGAFDPLKDPALVGYWSFNEGQGTTAADSSSYQRDGTLQGGATWAPGRFGSGVLLNGTSSYVRVSNFQLTTDRITMVAWIKGWKANDWAAIVTGQPARLELCFGDNNTLRYTWNGDSSATWGWAGGPVIPQDTWAMVAVTIDPAKAVEYVYSDQGGLTEATNAIAHISQTFTQLTFGFSFDPRYVRGTMDEVALYSRALTREEILTLTKGPSNPALAVAPSPADGATDVPQDASLSWTAGQFAATHDVYLGTAAADVNNASRAKPGGVLAGQGQTATTFTPAALLDFGQTYYWRVDEANKPADNTIFKGDVWSFTAEPYSYPIAGVTATASCAQNGMGPENTVNGSGMTGDQHGTDVMTTWMCKGTPPNWIQYQLDAVYKLDKLMVWNSNQVIEPYLGFGVKDVTVEYSVDGTTWTALANVPEFAQATGMPGYEANTTVNFGGVAAKYVKLTINTNWGGLPSTGLAEVRFYSVPVQARAPQPAPGATGAETSTILNWRPGREATSHQVFFGTDPNAVLNGTVAAQTATGHSLDAGTLQYGTTYYWKVDEVGTAATYPGVVWSFTTQEFAAADDFESYTDEEGSRIYETWVDGWTNSTGSTVGHLVAPFAEQAIVHGGKQSMPMDYNNAKTPFYSETERDFAPAQDWTGGGATSVSVWFRGYPVTFLDKGNNAFTVSGGGNDIWNNADAFRFAYKTLTGNGSITVKVDSVGNTNGWAKAGVMIRNTLTAGSMHADVVVTPSNNCSFQYRQSAEGTSASADWSGTAVAAPYWVRLTRTGNVFKAETSPDGKTWKQLGTDTTILMASSVYIGIPVTSHDTAQVTTAEVSNVSTTGNVTGAWQVAAIGSDPQPGNSPDKLYIVVQDSAGKNKTVVHPDPAATVATTWQQWLIPLSDFTSAGVKMTSVKKVTIGVGDRSNPKAGGAGTIYVDDLGFGKSGATK